MDVAALLAYFGTSRASMLDAIQQLVFMETPSRDKARLDALTLVIAKRLSEAGATVQRIPQHERGDHLRVTFSHGVEHAAPVLILCHCDTVWPVGSLATHPFRIEDGKAYGPGIFDMKSSLVLVEYALRAVRDLDLNLPRPITILVTSDEEIGSGASRALIETEARRAAHVLVLESPLPGGVLKTERKGIGTFTVETIGRAAHAGVDPDKGVNAIEEMAHQVLAVHSLANRNAGTTVSAGVIEGGTASNVIPANCKTTIDVRAWTQAEADRVSAAMAALQPRLAGAQVRVEGGWNRPPLERSATANLFQRVRAAGALLGLDLQEGATGGGSDGNFTGALGVPTLDGLGVPGDGAHADHEHILVDAIPERAALLVASLVTI
ncbi:MAG: M20 family metallopeptidase [Anaerolineales bacterium]|nr:M20 family metallopeptidase [Anaerolineales bacterium]